MRKFFKIDGKFVQLSSDQLSQRLLVYVVRREANLRSNELNVRCNLPVPHDIKTSLSGKGNKQQWIDLFF